MNRKTMRFAVRISAVGMCILSFVLLDAFIGGDLSLAKTLVLFPAVVWLAANLVHLSLLPAPKKRRRAPGRAAASTPCAGCPPAKKPGKVIRLPGPDRAA